MNFRVGETPFQAENQYLVREQIGAGGMGTIYRAFDIQLRRDVALKVLNTLDPAALERFVREREITADLDHPHFVRVLSMGTLDTAEGRRPFYTMPLLRGVTLADLVQRRLAQHHGAVDRHRRQCPGLAAAAGQLDRLRIADAPPARRAADARAERLLDLGALVVAEVALSLVLLDADYENSTRVIDRLMERMNHYDFPAPLRLSVGAACYPTDAVDAESLQREAVLHPVISWRGGHH